MPALDFLGFFFIMALFALGGLWHSARVKTSQAYLLANRHTGLFALVATLVMTELNTSTLISFSSAGYAVGDWAITLPLIFLVGLSFYALTVARKYRDLSAMSVAQVFSRRYGKDYSRAVSICLITAMLGFSATYVRSMTLFFSPLLRINPWVLSFILICAVVIFTLRGGLIAVIRSDIVSFILVIFYFPLVYYWTYTFEGPGSSDALTMQMGQTLLPPNFVASLIVLTAFTYILAPWYGQKIFSARNSNIAYWSVFLSAGIVFLLYSVITLSCSLLQKKGIKLSSAENALPFILANVIPVGARGVSFAMIFTIGATTLAGVWSAMTTMVVGDFLSDDETSVARPMMITLIFAACSFFLANTLVDNVFNKLILANIPVFAISFSLLAAFYWPRATRASAYASTAVGLFWGIYCYAHFGEANGYTIYWAFLGLPLIFLTGIVVSLLQRNHDVVAVEH